jgi:hypothetical protein
VAAQSGWKHPPAGVPSEPDPTREYVPLKEAAQRLGVDRRTLLTAIKRGDTAGWARPGPGHLRWYVYEDSSILGRGSDAVDRVERLEAENTRLRAQLAGLHDPARAGDQSAEAIIADLRARLVMAEESNLLLIAAHADLAASADKLRAAHTDLSSGAEKYRQALSLYMTPGHIGDLLASGGTTPPP